MKTLADRILEAGSSNKFEPFSVARCKAAAAEIKQAQRFVVTQDVRESCRLLLLSRPSSLVAALRWARPPFSKTWLEWETPEHLAPIHAVRVKVRQIGAMLTATPGTDNQAFTAWTAWSYDWRDPDNDISRVVPDLTVSDTSVVPGIGMSAVELGIDFTVPVGDAPQHFPLTDHWVAPDQHYSDAAIKALRDDHHNNLRFASDPVERDSLRRLIAPIRWRGRSDPASIFQLKSALAFGSAGARAAIDDVRDEVGPIMSMLILMNSRNCVDRQAVIAPPKLVAARLKSGNKPPPLDHTLVRIHLSPTQQRLATAGCMNREEARRHLVRGHFKTRRTGVYWWSDFSRGNPSSRVEHDYLVTS